MPDTREGLPPLLAEIADVAGLPAALALGTDPRTATRRVRIPRRATAGCKLAQVVGMEAAKAIVAGYGGDTLTIPSALVGQARQRRRAIAAMTEAGLTVGDISSSIGIDRRTVQRQRARRRVAPKPLPLFDR